MEEGESEGSVEGGESEGSAEGALVAFAQAQ